MEKTFVHILDSSLRDGSHALSHQYTAAQVSSVARALDDAGVEMIEVSHGDGLGGSTVTYGFSKQSEMELIQAAAEVIKKITRSDTVNWLGLCAGGITTALMLGYLAATGDASAGSATFIVTMLTNRCPNIIGMMDTGDSRKVLRRAAAEGQVLPARSVRTSFAWLRPNDLVFNYLVSGWLLGQDPPSFDVLAWNDGGVFQQQKLRLVGNVIVCTAGTMLMIWATCVADV